MQKVMNKVKRRKEKIHSIQKKVKSYKVLIKTEKLKKNVVKLPGVVNFWNIDESLSFLKNIKQQNGNDEDESNNGKKKQRLTASERYQRYMDEEERIRKIEEEMSNPNLDPHTPEQFERVLLNDKNNSYMWIKYMAFHLETAEIDKARSIAKKAIASINFREERELLNVWIALLNLEIRFGTDETYQEVLNDATQRNDPFKIYSQTLKILLDLEKFIDANKIIEILKKRFKPLPDMWLLVTEAYLKMDNEKIAKEMLPKSLLSLTEKNHLDYMTKFALLMSRHNIHDFSQTIFEKILSTYSKNVSLWFIYIDMMVKNGQTEIARSLFDRMLVYKFPLKKLKSVFQKYIEFESKHGDNANVSKIKKIAKSMLEKHDE